MIRQQKCFKEKGQRMVRESEVLYSAAIIDAEWKQSVAFGKITGQE